MKKLENGYVYDSPSTECVFHAWYNCLELSKTWIMERMKVDPED